MHVAVALDPIGGLLGVEAARSDRQDRREAFAWRRPTTRSP
jgi:hypothetical protein